MSNENILLPFEQAPVEARVPANPSPEWLLAQWKERQDTRFAAHAIDNMAIAIGGKDHPLSLPGLCVIVAKRAGVPNRPVGIVASEHEARMRCAELGTMRCATGFHSWS